jgi:Domain of unknown function (DUF1841)
MFAPSQDDVRRFICAVYEKSKNNKPLNQMEAIVSIWLDDHPEYAVDFSNIEKALATVYTVTPERENPFLHLAMHLSISEQCSIDQPQGIRQAVDLLASKNGNLHAAHHAVMDCLGRILYDSQIHGSPPDGNHYIELIQNKVTKD